MAKYPPVDYGLRRFAVLHHSGVDQPHYDFMFETSDTSLLVTFRLAEWPVRADQPATKLRDHRRLYLTFQGSIAGDRGTVERVDEGQLRVTETATGWMLRRADDTPFALLEPEGDEWRMILAEA